MRVLETGEAKIGRGRPVTVIGAGFSGLVSAFHLKRAGFDVTVIEASSKPGGLIGTVQTPYGLVERAANGLLNSAAVEGLFSAIGLEIAPTLKESRKRYIFRAGRPRRWPLGIIATLNLGFFILKYLFQRKRLQPHREETVRSWAERAMGSEAASYTVEAALQGIYAGNPARMSASVIFGRFFARKAPDVRRKPKIRGTVSAPRGMGQLIESLHAHLVQQGVKFRFNEMAQIESKPPHPVIVATSCDAAAQLLQKHSPERAQLLSQIERLPIVSATVFFRETDSASQGFGCLFPPVENRRVLGVLKNNFIFKGRASEGYSETWILGGANFERIQLASGNLLQASDNDILGLIASERQDCFQVPATVFEQTITRWEKALPHYTVDLEKALPHLNGLANNVVLVGNYLGQIGLAKILERAENLPHEVASLGAW